MINSTLDNDILENVKSNFGEDFSLGYLFLNKGSDNCIDFDEIQNEFENNFLENFKSELLVVQKIGLKKIQICLSWENIIVDVNQNVNLPVVEMYLKAIDFCIKENIEPFLVLSDGCLPSKFKTIGGWEHREVIVWFEYYAAICAFAFKDKVKNWLIFNQTSIFSDANDFLNTQTPTKKKLQTFIPTIHHVVLCQSVGYKILKKIIPNSFVGTTFSFTYLTPKTYTEKNIKAVERADALLNEIFLEPTLGLGYPFKSIPFLKNIFKYFEIGDEELIKVNFDFVVFQNHKKEEIVYNSYIPYLNAKIGDKQNFNVNKEIVFDNSFYQMVLKFSQYGGINNFYASENNFTATEKSIWDLMDDKQRSVLIQLNLQKVNNAKRKSDKFQGCFFGFGS